MNNPVIELVKAYEGFIRQNPTGSLEDFCDDFVTQARTARSNTPVPSDVFPKEFNALEPSEDTGKYLGRVAKHLYFYCRKIIQPLPMDNIEDFAYLAEAYFGGVVKRSALINKNLSEFTSGTNVINRLIKAGHLEEFPDAKDARSKQVKITELGITVIVQCIQKMNVTDKVLFDILTDTEKKLFTQLLRKIDTHHSSYFVDFRNLKLEEIITELKVK